MLLAQEDAAAAAFEEKREKKQMDCFRVKSLAADRINETSKERKRELKSRE